MGIDLTGGSEGDATVGPSFPVICPNAWIIIITIPAVAHFDKEHVL